MSDEPRKNRAILRVGCDLFLEMLFRMDGKTALQFEGLPADVVFSSVYTRFDHRTIEVMIESASLPPTPDGQELPTIPYRVAFVPAGSDEPLFLTADGRTSSGERVEMGKREVSIEDLRKHFAGYRISKLESTPYFDSVSRQQIGNVFTIIALDL